MTKRGDPEFLEVLVRQIRQDAKANVVLGKALSVLPQPELLQPFCNRLHRGRPADLVWPDRAIGPSRQRAYPTNSQHRMSPGSTGQAGHAWRAMQSHNEAGPIAAVPAGP